MQSLTTYVQPCGKPVENYAEGNPRTQELLEKNGVKVDTVDISEIMKGKGALHCITAYLKRG